MTTGNQKKNEQLKMSHSKARGILMKSILLNLIRKLNLHFCFQCGKEILSEDELSVEHKIPYLDSEYPVKLFFDLDNIAFSHLRCNCNASRRNLQYYKKSSKESYRGVISPSGRRKSFRSRYSFEGKLHYLGNFNTALEAALAYDIKVTELFGDKAITNKSLNLL